MNNNSFEVVHKISVIVPVFNVEKYIEKTIDSIIHQTYENLDIIIVNDGSLDSSYDVCKELAKTDIRIRLFSQENQGLSAARNTGIENAEGEYIVFIDGDDFIHPQMIELLLKSLIENKADISICSFERKYENNPFDLSLCEDESITQSKCYSSNEAIACLFDNNTYIPFTVAWNKLYRKEIFDDIRYPKGRIHEDEFVIYRVFSKAEKVVYIENKLYYYLQREGSIMNTPFSTKRFDKVIAYKERAEYFIEHHLFEFQGVKTFLCEYCYFLYRYSKKLGKTDEYKKLKRDALNAIGQYKVFLPFMERMKILFKIVFPRIAYKFFRFVRRLKKFA